MAAPHVLGDRWRKCPWGGAVGEAGCASQLHFYRKPKLLSSMPAGGRVHLDGGHSDTGDPGGTGPGLLADRIVSGGDVVDSTYQDRGPSGKGC
jgi:hypothetical protein